MPMALIFRRHSRSFSFVFMLTMGFCFLKPFGLSKAFGDVSPSFYDQGQNNKSSPASASQSMPLPEENPTPSPGFFATLVRVVFALAITVGLIVATVWGLKWVWEKRGWNQLSDEGKPLRVLASLYLAPRKTIQLVEVGKRILVVGVGNEEINCLDVIREPEEVEVLKNVAQQGFPRVFNRILQRHDADKQETEASKIFEESRQAVGDYVAKLKDIKKKKNMNGSADEKE